MTKLLVLFLLLVFCWPLALLALLAYPLLCALGFVLETAGAVLGWALAAVGIVLAMLCLALGLVFLVPVALFF